MQNSLLLFVSFDLPFNYNYVLQKISSKALLSILGSYILVYCFNPLSITEPIFIEWLLCTRHPVKYFIYIIMDHLLFSIFLIEILYSIKKQQHSNCCDF